MIAVQVSLEAVATLFMISGYSMYASCTHTDSVKLLWLLDELMNFLVNRSLNATRTESQWTTLLQCRMMVSMTPCVLHAIMICCSSCSWLRTANICTTIHHNTDSMITFRFLSDLIVILLCWTLESVESFGIVCLFEFLSLSVLVSRSPHAPSESSKGVPEFWLTVLKNTHVLAPMIEVRPRQATSK